MMHDGSGFTPHPSQDKTKDGISIAVLLDKRTSLIFLISWLDIDNAFFSDRSETYHKCTISTENKSKCKIVYITV